MRFDVIIGNPPYQSPEGRVGNGTTPLYIKFVMLAQWYVKTTGTVAMITPPTAFKIGMGGYVRPESVVVINLDAGEYFEVRTKIWYFIQQHGRTGLATIVKNRQPFQLKIEPDTILTAENETEHHILTKIQRYRDGISLVNIVRNAPVMPIGAVFLRRMNRNPTFNALITYENMAEDIALNQDYTLVHEHAEQIVKTLNSPAYTFLWTRYQTSPFITLEWIRSLTIPTENIYQELGFTENEIHYIENLCALM